jgi:tRNA(adenine34) deaminase
MMSVFGDEYFMKEALKEAQAAFERDEVPVGCVIVFNNRIIARSHNLTECLNDVTAHAEMQAITAAANTLGGKYLIDCKVYVTLEPCGMCASALNWAQISEVIYGASDEKKGYNSINPKMLHPKTVVKSGVLEKECSEIVKLFFQKKRSKRNN